MTEGSESAHNFNGLTCVVCGAENTKTISCQGINFVVPVEITADNYGTKTKISDITIAFEDVYSSYSRFFVNYSAYCINDAGYGNGFCYALYDKDGYVVASDVEYTTDMKTGDKTKNQSFSLDLPHISGDLKKGETYKLVISNND